MVRAVSEAEIPEKVGSSTDDRAGFVPREQTPQQVAQEPPAMALKEPKTGSQGSLAKLIKELGQITDPDLKEASRSRRKSLKAVLQALQNPNCGGEERSQLLTKTLVAQASEVGKLERMVVPVQQNHDRLTRLLSTVEQELSKQTSLNDKLQSLCRSLQSQNKLLKEQLDRKESLSQAEREQSNSLQQAMQSITARLDEEKDRLSQLQEATEQNAILRNQITNMSRQIEVQQQLSERQEEKHKGIQELLLKQREEDIVRQRATEEVMTQLRQQNQALLTQVSQQEALLTQQQQQFQECNEAIRAATQGFESYQQRLEEKQKEVSSLTTELTAFRKLHKVLRGECGEDILEGARKRNAQVSALQGLCRAQQEEIRQLKAGAAPKAPADSAADSATSAATACHQDVAAKSQETSTADSAGAS